MPKVELRPACSPPDRRTLLPRPGGNLPPRVGGPFMYNRPTRSTAEEHARWLFAGIRGAIRRRRIPPDPGRRRGPPARPTSTTIDRVQGRAGWALLLPWPTPSVRRARGVGGYVEFPDDRSRPLGSLKTGGLGLAAKLWCEVAGDQRAGCGKLHQKFGFRQGSAAGAPMWSRTGQPTDVMGLGLLAEDWRGVRPAMVERAEAAGLRGQLVSRHPGDAVPPQIVWARDVLGTDPWAEVGNFRFRAACWDAADPTVSAKRVALMFDLQQAVRSAILCSTPATPDKTVTQSI